MREICTPTNGKLDLYRHQAAIGRLSLSPVVRWLVGWPHFRTAPLRSELDKQHFALTFDFDLATAAAALDMTRTYIYLG